MATERLQIFARPPGLHQPVIAMALHGLTLIMTVTWICLSPKERGVDMPSARRRTNFTKIWAVGNSGILLKRPELPIVSEEGEVSPGATMTMMDISTYCLGILEPTWFSTRINAMAPSSIKPCKLVLGIFS